MEEESSLPADDPAADSDSAEARLNRFILSHRPGSPQLTVAPDSPASKPESPVQTKAPAAKAKPQPKESREPKKATPPDGLLSESLAKIYIKTRRYEQAYEILNGLSLRFPEKSSYFADQLRFLRKLILNERRRQIENQSKNNPNP